MVKHNNALVNNHFRKLWDRRVRTWFNQPGRKQSRRDAREVKRKGSFPRPASGLLRPVVHCSTKRYSSKERLGRGFTFDELKAAGVQKRVARGLGISVDHRRKNQNKETFTLNVERIKSFRTRQVIFPTNTVQKAKKTEKAAALLKHKQIQTDRNNAVQIREPLPLRRSQAAPEESRAISEEERKASAFVTLRKAKMASKKAGEAVKKANAKEKELATGAGNNKKPEGD